MKSDIKSGSEILQDFFENLEKDDSLDSKTVDAVVALFKAGKLSDRNISNALRELRVCAANDKD